MSSSSPSPAVPLSKKKSERMLVAPSGVRPSQKFLMKGPDGTSVSFVIPSHVRPGESFKVDVPLASLHSKDLDIKREIREKIEALERGFSSPLDNEAIKLQIQNKIKILEQEKKTKKKKKKSATQKTDTHNNTKQSSNVLTSLQSEIEAKSKELDEMKKMIEIQSGNLQDLIEKVERLTTSKPPEPSSSKQSKPPPPQQQQEQQQPNLSRTNFLRLMNNTPISKMSVEEVRSADRMLVGFANMMKREEVRTILRRLSYDGQFDRALSLLKHIKNSKIKENPETFGALITANIRSKVYSHNTILRLLKVMREKNVSPDCITVNKILTKCWKHGNSRGVDDVVKMLPWFNITLDLDSYRSIIGTYAKQFMTERVCTMLSVMDQNNVQPDDKIFALSIQSCGKDVERARDYIQEMQERHGMYPNKFHYTELAMVYMRANRADEIESVLIPEMSNNGVETDDIFVQQYGLHYCRDSNWKQTLQVFRRLFPDPEARVGWKVILIMNQLRKWKRWEALAEFFEDLDTGKLRKERKGGIPENIVRSRHLQAAIDAYGQLGEWEKVLSTYDRLEKISKNIKPESRNAVLRQSADVVAAARKALSV